MKYKWNYDCRSFPGTFACDILRANNYKSCEDCKFYEPVKKILIVKYGAAGDILRTTPILKALREKYENVQIYWLTNKRDKILIQDNPEIDYKLSFNFENILRLKSIKFHALFSLEIDKEICSVANLIDAEHKFGYYLDKNDNPAAFNKKAEYYLEKAWSDKLNKENRKTYQELLFDICELEYKKQDYSFYLNRNEEEISKKLKGNNNFIIGISIATAKRWPSKLMSRKKIIGLMIQSPVNAVDFPIVHREV